MTTERRIPLRHVAEGSRFLAPAGCGEVLLKLGFGARSAGRTAITCAHRDNVNHCLGDATGSSLVTLLRGEPIPACGPREDCGCRDACETPGCDGIRVHGGPCQAPDDAPSCDHADGCCRAGVGLTCDAPKLRRARGVAHGYAWESVDELPEACALSLAARLDGYSHDEMVRYVEEDVSAACMSDVGGCGRRHAYTAKPLASHDAPAPIAQKPAAPASLPDGWDFGDPVPRHWHARGFVVPDEPFALDVTAVRDGNRSDRMAVDDLMRRGRLPGPRYTIAMSDVVTPERRPYSRARRTR